MLLIQELMQNYSDAQQKESKMSICMKMNVLDFFKISQYSFPL